MERKRLTQTSRDNPIKHWSAALNYFLNEYVVVKVEGAKIVGKLLDYENHSTTNDFADVLIIETSSRLILRDWDMIRSIG